MKRLLVIATLMLALVFTIVACDKTPAGTDTTVADTTVEAPSEDATTEEPVIDAALHVLFEITLPSPSLHKSVKNGQLKKTPSYGRI